MDKVTGKLWIGDIVDARNLSTADMDRVVTVCQDSVESNVGCRYNHFPLADGEPEGRSRGRFSYALFREAVDTVRMALQNGETVLVHCHVGQSRSVAVAAAALSVENDARFPDAVWKVKQVRPMANPSHGLKRFGKRYVSDNR